MSLESMVFDFYRPAVAKNRYPRLVKYNLDCIRDYVQPVVEGMGYTWTDKTEQILIDAALNYSSSWCMSFMEFFMRRLKNSVKSTIVGG